MKKETPSYLVKVKEKHPEFIDTATMLGETLKKAGPPDCMTVVFPDTIAILARANDFVDSF